MPEPSSIRHLLCCAALATVSMAASAKAPRWDFVVQLDPRAEILSLHGCSAAALDDLRLRAGSDAHQFLVALTRGDRDALRADSQGARISHWQAGECFDARVDLKAAGQADRFGIGRGQDYWRIPLEKWFWRPRQLDPDSSIEFRFPPGWSESVPWTPMNSAHRYRLGATPDDWPAQTAFGRFSEQPIQLPGGRLRVAMLPLVDATRRQLVLDWFKATAPVLLASDGRAPLPDTQVLIVPLPGVSEPVPWGQVSRGGAAGVALFVGADAGPEAWRQDWTTAHELAHLQHPYLGNQGRWLAEGLASYYQNVWRARTGNFSAAEAWRRLDAGFKRGRAVGEGPPLAELGRGWGGTMRVYWAGAAYWLESDIALRQHGSSLDAVLGGFRRKHLPSERYWSPDDFIAALDTQAPEAGLLDRYRSYASARQFPDLRESYRTLGLKIGRISDEELVPSALRDSIMERR
jgi:hypothetical protein